MDVSSFAAYIPLGVLGLVRWASWLVRRVPASLNRPARTGHFEPLTIVVPVYQEDRRVFRQALESWLANRVEEVICVIDRTDEACLRIARQYPVRVIPTDVPGKRDALRRGWEAARTPLVALVDSDTIWAADVADRVCEPFADPRVGGVGTRQNVAEPRTVWEHLNDMYLGNRIGIEVYGGAYGVRLVGNEVRDSAQKGIVLEAPGTTSRDDRVDGAPVGVEVRAPARLRGTAVSRANQGIVVTDRGIAAIDDATVAAAAAGVDIRPGGLVRLRTSSIEAATPLSGSPPRAVLANTLVAPPGPLPWLALAGAAYLVVAIALQLVHQRRNRTDRRLREVPQGVAKW